MPRSYTQSYLPCQPAKITAHLQAGNDNPFSYRQISHTLVAMFIALSLSACGGGGGGGGGGSDASTNANASYVDVTKMTLTWSPVANADLGYLVYYGHGLIKNPTPASTLLTTPKITFNAQKDFGLSSGDYACFWVQAVNSAGMSGLSEPVCGVV